eukprot:234653-Pyramimonas_sp.AAC.1
MFRADGDGWMGDRDEAERILTIRAWRMTANGGMKLRVRSCLHWSSDRWDWGVGDNWQLPTPITLADLRFAHALRRRDDVLDARGAAASLLRVAAVPSPRGVAA